MLAGITAQILVPLKIIIIILTAHLSQSEIADFTDASQENFDTLYYDAGSRTNKDDDKLYVIIIDNGTVEIHDVGDAITTKMDEEDFKNEIQLLLGSRKFYNDSPNKIERNKKRRLQKQQESIAKRKQAHKIYVDEIMKFLEPNIMSTRYIHNEVMRIQRTRQVRDDLRRMVWMMDQESLQRMHIEEIILDCFRYHLRLVRREKQGIWNQPTNNLIVHEVKDPYNENVSP